MVEARLWDYLRWAHRLGRFGSSPEKSGSEWRLMGRSRREEAVAAQPPLTPPSSLTSTTTSFRTERSGVRNLPDC